MKSENENVPSINGEKSPMRIAADDFLESRDAMGLSEHTVKHYAKTLRIFLGYLGGAKVRVATPRQLTGNHIKGFYAWARREKNVVPDTKKGGARNQGEESGGGYAAATVHQLATDVRALCNWMADEIDADGKPLVDGSPHTNVKMPKRPDKVLPPFSEDEISKLYEATKGNDWLRVRDRAMLLFLLDTAVRRSECQQTKIGSLSLEQGIVTIAQGKGGSTRQSVFQKTTAAALKKYLRAKEMQGKDNDSSLWWGKYGPLTPDGVGEVFEAICKRAKVQGSPHKARRTAAIRMLRNDASLESVRRLLGHRDYQCIQKYLAFTDKDLKRAHDLHSPVESLGFLNNNNKNVRAGKKRNGNARGG